MSILSRPIIIEPLDLFKYSRKYRPSDVFDKIYIGIVER